MKGDIIIKNVHETKHDNIIKNVHETRQYY